MRLNHALTQLENIFTRKHLLLFLILTYLNFPWSFIFFIKNLLTSRWCPDISSPHIKLHKHGETVGEGSVQKWCVSLPVFMCNCSDIDLNGITHPLLLIHLKVDIDFLLLCQWECTPLTISFLSHSSLPQCHWISDSFLSFTLLYFVSRALSVLPHPYVRLSHALSLIFASSPRGAQSAKVLFCFFFFFFF